MIPVTKPRVINDKGTFKANAIAFAKLLAALREGPCTYWELNEATGLHYNTLRHYLGAMHREELVHVSGWEKDSMGRDALAVWSWGEGKDKPKRRLSNNEKARRYRARLRKGLIGTALGVGRPSIKKAFTEARRDMREEVLVE